MAAAGVAIGSAACSLCPAGEASSCNFDCLGALVARIAPRVLFGAKKAILSLSLCSSGSSGTGCCRSPSGSLTRFSEAFTNLK